MPTLTIGQRQDFRLLTGDDETPYDLSDEKVQELYDLASGQSTDAEQVNNLTIVYMLRRLLAMARRKVDRADETGARETRSQLFANLRQLLTYYEGLAGIGGGAITAGVIDLDLDEPCPDGVDCHD